MKRSEAVFGILRIPVDAAAVCAALLVSYRLREASIDLIPRVQLLEPPLTLPPLPVYFETFMVPGIFIFLLLAALLRLYVIRTTRSSWNEMSRILVTSLLWIVTVMAWYFLIRKQLFYSRVLLLHATFFIILFTAFGRAAVTVLQRAFLRIGIGTYAVVSMGHAALTASAEHTLLHDVRYRYLGHKGNVQGIQGIAQERDIDLVLHTDPHPASDDTHTLIAYCRSHHIGYAFLPPVLAENPHQLAVDHLGLVPMLRFQPTPLDGWGRVAKRMFDVVASIVLLTLLSPLLLLITIVILLDSGLPILYVSERVGEQSKRSIKALKFRTMVRDADARKSDLKGMSHRRDGPLFKVKNDPRVTRVGRMLRRLSFDEFPQLWNVLRGEMSLVGPRPHLAEEVARYADHERRVFAVKPGITGLAQVSGRSNLSFEEEVRLDLQYIEEWSLFLDLWILWRTVFVVVGGRGAD